MGKKYNLVLSEKMVATLPATPETTVKKRQACWCDYFFPDAHFFVCWRQTHPEPLFSAKRTTQNKNSFTHLSKPTN
jgi:hypothetical protein